ncbi:DoxX family protein [uncultured Croceicoccus sp.]|uniref:DoxX family protein n=1 Tax=uncultured Croceicoccus sp. TaxID=1295329 RepID=UPI00260AFDBA|nr:DoxX family protein [uncultured Croceicoccus sp.]
MDRTRPIRQGRGRTAARWLLALAYFVAGVLHLAAPAPFLGIMPDVVPWPEAVVALTGIAEILGAIGMVQPVSGRLRKAAAVGLALYAVCVFPANINHFAMDMGLADHGLGLAYHLPRMVAQPVLVWLALWSGGVMDWPWRRRTG